jgi:FdhD protein
MVIKTVQMGIPVLVSRSGFTAWGVDLAKEAGLTLIGRAKGKRFTALAGQERMIFDHDASHLESEDSRHQRASSRGADREGSEDSAADGARKGKDHE